MKKLLALISCFVLSFSLIVGCEQEPTENVLRVGLECGYAPFNWTESKNTNTNVKISGGGLFSSSYCDGYDVQVARFVAEDLGLTLVIKKIDWDGLIIALQENKIDAIIAGMSPTAERQETINFTNDYFNSEQVIVVRKSSLLADATTLAEFAGKTLVAQLGTLQDTLIQNTTGVVHGTAYPTYPDAFAALMNITTIDGVVAEYPVAQSAVASNSSLAIVRFSAGNGFAVEDEDVLVSIGLRKEDTDLLTKINSSLAKISTQTREQWMLEAITRQP